MPEPKSKEFELTTFRAEKRKRRCAHQICKCPGNGHKERSFEVTSVSSSSLRSPTDRKRVLKTARDSLSLFSPFRSSSTSPSPEVLALKHKSRISGQSSNPVCGFSMMEQVRLCAVWPMENWLGSSLNQMQGWTTVRES